MSYLRLPPSELLGSLPLIDGRLLANTVAFTCTLIVKIPKNSNPCVLENTPGRAPTRPAWPIGTVRYLVRQALVPPWLLLRLLPTHYKPLVHLWL